MKLLLATPYFYPHTGGLEQYAEHIATGLAARGWEVHVVTSGPATSTSRHRGLTIHRLATAGRIANTPFGRHWSRQIQQLIQELQPDIINAHAPVPTMALATERAIARTAAHTTRRTPFVITYHAGSMKKHRLLPDALIWGYEQHLLPRLLGRSQHIICASDFVREQFLAPWQHKSTTITPGVDTELFQPGPTAADPKQIIFVGDFRDPRKGLSHLLGAMHLLPHLTLRVVGPGQPQPQAGVSYAGVAGRAQLARELQSSSLLVLPSVSQAESFGMVLLEAMACGLPVIGSRIGGIPYVISEARDGLLVPPANAPALAAAIQTVQTNPTTAHALGRAGRHKATSGYTWSSRIDATHQLFERLLSSAQPEGDTLHV
jgi:glycosyltransferase involved in cell wall biosynthesis